MAIIKGIENQYGADFNYHRISEVKIISVDGDVQIRIITDSYVDKEARIQGKKAVRTENIMQHASFALEPFYALLKAKFGDFMDAADDFEQWHDKTTQPTVITQQTPQGQLISRYTEMEEVSEAQEAEKNQESNIAGIVENTTGNENDGTDNNDNSTTYGE